MDPREKIIVAFDFKTMEEVKNLTTVLKGQLKYAKVGMELFYSLGKEVIEYLKSEGVKIFLDLKLHDIPNTVGNALGSLQTLGVDMVNVHASGGKEMLKAARDNFSGTLIAVTQLTSISQEMMNKEQNISGTIEDQVSHLANLANDCGLDGVVCSALEASRLRSSLGKKFVLVTPGVRLDKGNAQDQSRVATPGDAISFGATYLVVGREITQSKDPKAVFQKFINEVS